MNAQKNIQPPYAFSHLGHGFRHSFIPVKVLKASPNALDACAEKKLKLRLPFSICTDRLNARPA